MLMCLWPSPPLQPPSYGMWRCDMGLHQEEPNFFFLSGLLSYVLYFFLFCQVLVNCRTVSILGYGINVGKIMKKWSFFPPRSYMKWKKRGVMLCFLTRWDDSYVACLGLLLLPLSAPYKYFCQCFICAKTASLCSVNIHPSLPAWACPSVGWFK